MIAKGRRIIEKHGMPGQPWQRRLAGVALIVGGLLGFLPVLGFWMIPLGLIFLSVDSPFIRRHRRRFDVWVTRRWNSWRAGRRNRTRRGK